MTTSKSIKTLYDIFEKMYGASNAGSSVSVILTSAIGDIQDDGLPVTEEAISQRLSQYAQDFLEASKSQVA
jgi:hypothetical protein